MRKIGFSHAVLYKILPVYTRQNIQLFVDIGCNAIEVNFHHTKDAPLLRELLPILYAFEYVSLHMPCDHRYGNNKETKTLLKTAENFYATAGAKLAVIHPDLVDDWKVFDNFDLAWAVENMDDRKKSYKNCADLEKFFKENTTWGLVLDLAHAHVNDPSMNLADEMTLRFKDKIREFHLSGYQVFHEPLHQTKQNEIIARCNSLDVPIIIESTFELSDDTDGARKEYAYILENINRRTAS